MELVDPGVPVTWLEGFPDLKSGRLNSRLKSIGQAIAQIKPDLLLTYNWGTVDALLANRLYGGAPAVHHEDGFGPEEAGRPLLRRSVYRWLAFPGAQAIIACSRNLERICLNTWHQPRRRVRYVPNGVDVTLFDSPPAADAIPGLVRGPGDLLVGTMAGLRGVKNLPRLVRAFAAARGDVPARLVIVGQGPDKAAIEAEAERLGIRDALVLPGFLAHPHRYVGLFDIFSITSDTEQFPISLAEAMAAGLPAVCTDVGDIAEMVSSENRPFIVDRSDEGALASALKRLLADADLRHAIGAANRAQVRARYGALQMANSYREIYRQAAAGGS